MKKVSTILGICLLSLLLFTSCASSQNCDSKTIIIDNQEYEISNNDWTPYTNISSNEEYYLYSNNLNTIFAKEKNSKLFDGVIYHNIDDNYPNISMREKVDKIICETSNEQISLENDIALLLCDELNNISNISNPIINIVDLSKEEIYVNVYYKDYPAYQTEFMICFTAEGVPGIMYCETSRNTKEFGKNNMMLFSNEKLMNYIYSMSIS